MQTIGLVGRSCSHSSNVASFQVEAMPGLDCVAFATADGCILVQQVRREGLLVWILAGCSACWSMCVAWHAHDALHPSACPLVQAVAAPAEPESAGPIPVPSSRHPVPGQFTTVLMLEEPSGKRTRTRFDWVAWGGGPGYLLCAASAQQLLFFSLRNFFVNQAHSYVPQLHTQTSSRAPSTAAASDLHAKLMTHHRASHAGSHVASYALLPLPTISWPLVASHWLQHPLLALDWTQDASGLLLTDEGQHVTMLTAEVAGADSMHVAQVCA